MVRQYFVIATLTILAGSLPLGSPFVLDINLGRVVSKPLPRSKYPLKRKYESSSHTSTQLFVTEKDELNETQLIAMSDSGDRIESEDNFDGQGFANYLGPYLIALVASIAVTAGFFNFILMDY
mmetsp:Transcript_27097/g.31541  ORF Transcript_27097/g.31541 Transcript_27097/m.31541 type:complete len:123 (-) Transcript_27097:113-481(-)